MKNSFYFLPAFLLVTALLLAFGPNGNKNENGGLKLVEVTQSTAYTNAKLDVDLGNNVRLDTGNHTFHFTVSNYQLGAQTPDPTQQMCANSSKGQHIHFILDNQPYVASYVPDITSNLKPGHHVLLSFLSRSYHESIKEPEAFILREFNVGDDALDNFDEKAPHIFYSRPKGEYIGDGETQKLLLDFYLVNCNLSKDGYKVRATINDKEFMLTKWAPYVVEGLPLGEVRVKLELLDKSGHLVKSPFNGVERTAKLLTEPLRK